MKESVEAGELRVAPSAMTIADGIAIKRPGTVTLPLVREFVDEIVTVTEDEIADGIAHCVQSVKLVTEGAGAAGVAALLAEANPTARGAALGQRLAGTARRLAHLPSADVGAGLVQAP